MRGLRTVWEKGTREGVLQGDSKGRQVPRLGKNHGPVVQQHVVKVMVPK